MQFRVINDYNAIDLNQWLDLLKKSNHKNVFQSPAMYKLWNSIEGIEPFVYASIDESDQIKVLITGSIQKESGKVKGTLTRRAIILGGPLLDDSEKLINDYLKVTLEAVSLQLKKKAIYIEIRNSTDYSEYNYVYQNDDWKYEPYLNFMINCRNETNMIKNMSKSKVRQIKKSIREGAEIIEAIDECQVLDFYHILHELYTKRVKKPLLSSEFFLNYFKQNTGKFLLVRYQNKIVGGVMCPILDSKAIYAWYLVGEDRIHPNIYPSILAVWAAMEYANRNNIEIFDFMGAGKRDQDYGVRNFKSQFGGERVEHGRYVKVLNPFLFELGKLGLLLYKKIK